jgi:adenylate cyclase
MTERVRQLRHKLLNQVNHIVGYAELLLEETEEPGPVTEGLDQIRSAGREVMAVVNRVLDPEVDEDADLGRLHAALEGPLGRVAQVAGALQESPGDEELARVLGQIAAAARQALALSADRVPQSLPAEEPEPRSFGPRQPAATGTGAGVGPQSSQGLVLVVDDDEANREVLARRLGRLGYAVLEAPDGRRALELMEGEPVDLVLLDLKMPELDGFGVLEARRDDPRLRDIPTIILSASGELASVVRCIEMGAEDYLPKPFDPVLLQARVGASLEKKRLRDQERELLATVQHQAQALAEWNETLEARVAEQVEELDRLARLRRFLSPQLADLLAKGEEDVLRTHRRDIAVLFVDLSGFTAFSEVSEPEDVMAVLSEFHEELGHLIAEFEATVGFFAGDGLMVFWNDPLPCPDPAQRAVRMAVAMRERVAERTKAWRKRGHDLGFAIGVALGYATLGEIGFEGRVDYGVIGSVVNLAARLCDHAEQDQILVSQRAALAVEEIAEVEELGLVTLKGFHAHVPAFNIVGLRERR